MLRGINRSIIEINETNNKYFEKVLVFVKPEFVAEPKDKLKKEAVDLINDYAPLPFSSAPEKKNGWQGGQKGKKLLKLSLPALLTAAAVWIIFKLLS